MPCIRDLRVTVSMVLGQLAGGRTIAEVLDDYPYLERADVLASLEFAAAVVYEREATRRPPCVRLLLDANLSPRLATPLSPDRWPSTHNARPQRFRTVSKEVRNARTGNFGCRSRKTLAPNTAACY